MLISQEYEKMGNKNIKKDTLFLLTSGVYEEYAVWGLFKALMDIDLEKVTATCKKDDPDNADTIRFGEWIVNKKIAERVDAIELHTGDYDFSLECRGLPD